MGSTTVRLGGGVTGAARNQTALTWNCLVSIRAGPIQAWPKAETTRLTNESIKLHFKQPIKITEISFKFNPRRLHHGHLSFARLSLGEEEDAEDATRLWATLLPLSMHMHRESSGKINGKLFQANNANLM